MRSFFMIANPLLLRESGIRLDLADLENVPLFVRRNEQRPLIRVARLPFDYMPAEIVFRSPDILDEPRMQLAMRLETRGKVLQPLRHFRRDGRFAIGPVDPVPENVSVAGG